MKKGPQPPYKLRPWQDRFWEQVDKRGPDECWEWKSCALSKKHGRFHVDRYIGNTGAHCVGFYFYYGRWPNPDLCVCHTCDNPPCCNGRHLFEGTHGDNLADSIAKGRRDPHAPHPWIQGERHFKAKLTDELVVQMREEKIATGTTYATLAERYMVDPGTAWRIVNRRNWKHI